MDIDNIRLPTKAELRRRLGVRKYTDVMKVLRGKARECHSIDDYKQLLLDAGWREIEVRAFLMRARPTTTVN